METERLDLINLLVEHKTISIDDVISVFKYDRKKLWYNIERINDSLKALVS